MIKFTTYDLKKPVFISWKHIISLNEGNPSGCVITTTRGVAHVAQSLDQCLTLWEKARKDGN